MRLRFALWIVLGAMAVVSVVSLVQMGRHETIAAELHEARTLMTIAAVLAGGIVAVDVCCVLVAKLRKQAAGRK